MYKDDAFRSGYIKIDEWDNELFYIMFESRSNTSADPLLIWL